MEVVVRKYGGSSLATPEHILQAARQIAELHHSGLAVITVVSAMGKSTDDLVNLAYSISQKPNRRELDMLLTTGERVSMSLLSMALHDLDCPAISFTGSQAGVLTNSAHSDALIHAIRPIRIVEALTNRQPVVLAGYQGVDPDSKEITTLGRGGSDTTAVAMAGHFKASRCEILKDVEGLYSADPKVVSNAHQIKSVSYDSLMDMCFWGSSILHLRSVELARNLNVPLYIGSSVNPESGTVVKKEVDMYEDSQILSVNSHQSVYHFNISATDFQTGFKKWVSFLKSEKLPSPTVLASVFEEEQQTLRIMCTGDIELLRTIEAASHETTDVNFRNLILASVTITANKTVSEEVKQQAITLLADKGISIQKLILSPVSCSLFIDHKERDRAVDTLHSLITSP